jgi:hypothetical protein
MSLIKRGSWLLAIPAVAAFAVSAIGCEEEKECVGAECMTGGSSSSSSGSGSSGSSGSGSSSSGEACPAPVDVPSVGPLVAISTITFSPDLSMRTDSIQFADKLSVDGKVEAGRTIELAGTNSTL